MLEALSKVSTAFKEPQKAAEKFAVATANIGKAAASAGKAAEKSAGGMSKFASSIARIAKYRLIRSVIRGIVDGIKEGATNFYNFSKATTDTMVGFQTALDGTKAAAQTMKNQLGAAFGTLYAQIAPIINSLISLVIKLANVLTMLFARLSGADGWYRAADGANAAADAASGAGKAAKEAMKYLAPFDELNRLPSDNKSGGGGGGGSSGSSGGDYEWVPFEQFDIGDGIQSIVQWFTDAFNGAAEWLESVDWSELPGKIITWISDEFKKIKVNELASAVAEFVGAALGAVTGFALGSIDAIVDWVSTEIYNGFHNADGSLKTGKEILEWLMRSVAMPLVGGLAMNYDTIIKPFLEGFEKAFGSNGDAVDGVGSAFCNSLFGSITSHLPDIGAWVREHIWEPIKDFFTTETPPDFGDGMTLPIKTDLSGFKLPDLKSFKKLWDGIKNRTPKLTTKLAGTKESVISKLSDKWNKIKTDTATLTANLVNNVNQNVLDKLKTAWETIKDAKAKFTASLNVPKTVTVFINAWNNLKDKKLELIATLSDKVKNAWNTAARAWNNSAILSKLGTLPYLAGGGMVNAGQVFIARESGPEIVGKYGNKTGVMNNQQIVDSVSRGVAQAIASIKFTLNNIPSITGFGGGMDEETMYRAMVRALTDSDIGDNETVVNLDGNVLYREVVRRNRNNTRMTGVNALA